MIETKNSDTFIDEVKDQVVEWRRFLHQNPELSFEEEKTSQFVFDTLQSFGGLEVSQPTKTSVMARLIGKQPGKVLAMRADMDALPINEENDFDFISQNRGVMHGCGHDGHTAMLLGAAKVLSQLKEQIQGEVRFIFQHAEEVPPGGAREMVAAGVMDGVDEVIGIHLMSFLPIGKIGLLSGPATANSDTFDITIFGKGGHSSQPEAAVDPIAIGSQVVNNLQHIVARNFDPQEKLVVSVTKFHGGTANNVIPDTVKLGGTVRNFSQEVREEVPRLMEKIVKGVTEAHGASCQLDYQFGYSSIVNNHELTKKVEGMVQEKFGNDYVEHLPPAMGSEDFSAFSQKAPGCFILVGARNEEKGIVHPHHHPRFTVDEDALAIGVKIFVNAPFELLG
ncbi:M20 family metallopeptidase [Pseudalkalibacillus decolorationis]|uniref:M20 family metallopeptidase n=1 Tax=Pseudalkalibacillus decolorationis TaxID=163879 RepID=UPI002149834A|nr:M20 family metallopeptidase [Pseudalkalibacillus decolorationis]